MKKTLDDPVLWALVGVNLVAKGCLLGLNAAEYTDGILQITLFHNVCSFYMPLYTLLIEGLALAGLDPILAGRAVSLLANTLILVPIYYVALWLTGRRDAARWAAALYMISPIPTRWALRVMTDSLFALLWWGALAGFLRATDEFDKEAPPSQLSRSVAVCLVLSVLAALTRQQGWILLPLGFVALFALWRQRGRMPTLHTILFFTWCLPVVWMIHRGTFAGHAAQQAMRAGETTWQTLALWAVMVEAYIAYLPYFLTYPLMVLLLFGVFNPPRERRRWAWFLGIGLWCALGILGLQCLIQSFLSRYLLPLIPFGVVLGGWGLALWEERQAKRPRIRGLITAITLIWLVLFTGGVLIGQRQAWGDFRQAAEEMGRRASPATPCFANENYATDRRLDTTKAIYWSHRQVAPLIDPHSGALADLPPGSLVLVSSAYGGPQAYGRILQALFQRYRITPVGNYEAWLLPLLPDIMAGYFQPALGLHQNPAAMTFRYTVQRFRTTLVRVEGPKGSD